MKHLITPKQRRARRTRAKLHGTADRPRISVHRTNKFIYVQAIDDANHKTLIGVASRNIVKEKAIKSEVAKATGLELAKRLKEKNITKGIFDRGSYLYHGRVKALADGLREGGLEL
ncbi:50S ribosomal protein L18 [Candidatus Microgenomates bacterium]|nr:50S ribosomal protein L18 [Candidatus Microgenomates bacterium]